LENKLFRIAQPDMSPIVWAEAVPIKRNDAVLKVSIELWSIPPTQSGSSGKTIETISYEVTFRKVPMSVV